MNRAIKALLTGIGLLLILCVAPGCAAPAAHNRLGNRFYTNQQYDQALLEYQTAQADLPDQPELHYNASNTLQRLGDYTSAISETVSLRPDAAPELRQMAAYNLGNAYFRQGEYASAIEAYKQALRLNPDDQDAKHNLELALQKLQEEQQPQQESSEDERSSQDQQNQEDQERQENTPAPGETATSQPIPPADAKTQTPSAQNTSENATTPTPASTVAPQPGQAGMTQEQARQLLEALAQDEQSLQEILARLQPVPERPVDRDW